MSATAFRWASWASLLFVGCQGPLGCGPQAPAGKAPTEASHASTPTAAALPAAEPDYRNGAPFLPGPPFGDKWCVTAEMVWFPELVAKWAPDLPRVIGIPGDSSRQSLCTHTVSAEDDHDDVVAWTVDCGRNYTSDSKFPREDEWTNPQVLLPLGGTNRHGYFNLQKHLQALDDDTPCEILVVPRKSFTKEQTIAVARDILDALTPERIAKPYAEIALGTPGASREEAEAEIARFKKIQPALADYAPLAEGYPRLTDHGEFPELPPGKTFVLYGICPPSRGEQLAEVVRATIPRSNPPSPEFLSTKVIAATGHRVACPETIASSTERSKWDIHESNTGQTIMVSTLTDDSSRKTGHVFARGLALLFNDRGELLDSLTVSEPVPPKTRGQGRYVDGAERTTNRCYTSPRTSYLVAPLIYMDCEVTWSDAECEKTPQAGATFQFSVENDKLGVSRLPMNFMGEDCKPAPGVHIPEPPMVPTHPPDVEPSPEIAEDE